MVKNQARKRLPEKMLEWLFEHTGETLTAEAGAEQRWQGRCVKVLDGSTVVMADTAANQKEYPQHKNQQPGCGFPIAKLVVMKSIDYRRCDWGKNCGLEYLGNNFSPQLVQHPESI